MRNGFLSFYFIIRREKFVEPCGKHTYKFAQNDGRRRKSDISLPLFDSRNYVIRGFFDSNKERHLEFVFIGHGGFYEAGSYGNNFHAALFQIDA